MAGFVWNLCGPMFRPDTFDPNNLGLDYSDGADARFATPGLVCGPGRTELDLGSAGGTVANTNAGAMIQRTSGGTEWFLYLLRGTRPTKIQVPSGNTSLSLASTQPTNSATGDLAARGISCVVTQAPGGNPMLSIGQEATNTYHNFTVIAAENAADTASGCNETTGGGQSRIVGMAADRMAGLNGQKIYGNVLTSTVTADASSWQEISTFTRANITPTGFAMTENLWVIGTSRGPLILNAQYKEFFPAAGLYPASMDNCRAMFFNPHGAGLFIPLVGQLRLQNGPYSQRVGPEAYNAPNVVQGTATGIGGYGDWTFFAFRNPKTATTYLVAGRPREEGAWHGKPFSFYTIDSFTNACEWVSVLEDPGSIRTNQVLAVGADDDLFYYRIGRTSNWTDDVSSSDNYIYRTATPQTAYGNRLHFDQKMDVSGVFFRSTSLASTRTLIVKIQYQDERGNVSTATVVTENSSGEHLVMLPQPIRGVRAFNPTVTLTTGGAEASPCLEHGRITVLAEPSQ